VGETTAARASLELRLHEMAARGYEFLRRQDATLWQELAPLLAASPADAARPETGHTQGPLELRLFGGLEARVDGVLLDAWPRRKTKVLLAALALHPGGLSSVELAEMLAEKEGKLDGIRAYAAALRRAFEPGLQAGASSRFVRLTQDRYTLVPELIGALDVQVFTANITLGDRLRPSQPEQARAAYVTALAPYRGNLLAEPLFEAYFEAEREGFRRQALAALFWLIERFVFEGDEPSALACLERAIALAPCAEEVATVGLQYHARRRSPERVRNVYWDYRKALHRTLGLVPTPELEASYRDALQQSQGGTATRPPDNRR
jgi:DNA-binding SARP family transcriptional activator